MRGRSASLARGAGFGLWLILSCVTCARYRGAARSEPADIGPVVEEPSREPPAALTAPVPGSSAVYQRGLATWYGPGFAGKRTTSGERFDPKAMTAAHRRLAFGTVVEVRCVDNGRAVRVRINDRGPFGDSRRVIDLAQHAAEVLGIKGQGMARVELRIVSVP